MASKIEWTTETWNIITGCTRHSEGCKNCYAEKMHKRLTGMGQEKYKEPFSKVVFHSEELNRVIGKSKLVFVNSMSDTFHASKIESSFKEGTQERWCHQCPHCGEYTNIVFDHIKFDYTSKIVKGKEFYNVTILGFACPHCGCITSEEDIRKQPAKWIAENPEAYENGHRSFWLNAFTSPWTPWQRIVKKFLEARKDPEQLKVVFNTLFGELWEDRGDHADEDEMLDRREEYNSEYLPDGVLALTCGVDTQDNRLEYEIVGHGLYGETWGIKKGWNQERSIANEEISDSEINWLLTACQVQPFNQFQILTKRAYRLPDFKYPENVWLGVTVENLKHKDRIEYLKKTNAKIKFLSCEPLLSDLGDLDLKGIDWVIAGGETGPGARAMHPEWVYNILRQCKKQNVPFFFKQWGEWMPELEAKKITLEKFVGAGMLLNFDGSIANWDDFQNKQSLMFKVGKKAAGSKIGGREYKEYPAWKQVWDTENNCRK